MRKEFITATLIAALQFSVAAQAQVTFEMIMPTYGPNGQVTWPDGTVSSSAGPSTEGTLQMMGYTDTTPGTVNQDVGVKSPRKPEPLGSRESQQESLHEEIQIQ